MNEVAGPRQIQHLVVNVFGDKRKISCCKDGHEGSRPGLGTLRRAFSRASQRASVRAPRGDARLLRLSGRFLFGSLRRTPDNSPAGDQTGATSEPGPACGRKGSSKAKEGVGRRSSTGEGPAEAEGEGSPTPLTEQRRKPRPERWGRGPGFLMGYPPQPLQTPAPAQLQGKILPAFQHAQWRKVRLREVK